MKRLENKIAIITGGNSGIGEATAKLFASEGAKVTIAARRKNEGLEVRDSILESGGSAEFIECDVTNNDQINLVVKNTVEKYGRIDIFIQ